MLDDCIGEVVCAVTVVVVAKRSIIAARWHAFVVISTVGVSNGRRLVRFIVFYVSRELFSNVWQNELWAFFRQRLPGRSPSIESMNSRTYETPSAMDIFGMDLCLNLILG